MTKKETKSKKSNKARTQTKRGKFKSVHATHGVDARDLITEEHLDKAADREYYDYGLAVIEDRAIFGDDGLKPVIRRGLWATHKNMGLHSNSKPDKAAKVVGETLGNYHPHGDSACLRGNTLVPLLSGKTVTIKSLSDSCAGKRWVLAYDEQTGRMVPAVAHSWREAKVTKKMLRLTMSSGEVQEVTYDHPFLSVTRKWTEAQHLKVGETLVGGTLIPQMEYPDVATNTGFRKRIHHIVGDHKFYGAEDDEVYHHIDENPKNNRPSNIDLLTKQAHAELHGDYVDGLSAGRKTMFGAVRTPIREAIAEKNSTMMRIHNENLWMIKAVKAIRLLIERKKALTPRNYEALRGEIYNLTKLETVARRGYTFKELCEIAPTFALDISEAVGLTEGLTQSTRSDKKPRVSPEYKLGMPHSFFDQVAIVLSKLLKRKNANVSNISWDEYRSAVMKMPSMGANANKVLYSKPEEIQARFDVETVEDFCTKLPACVLNVIVKIERVDLEAEETFYDFSVEKYKNMIVLTSDGERTGNFNVVHNCYGALITAAKSPVRMIDGEGNWGTMTDGAAAMRYTNMRLSLYSDLVFFDKFYLPTIQYVPNYDGSREEPLVFPALLPNSVINGNFGIAPGVNTRTPSYTLKSVFAVLEQALESKKGVITPEMCVKELVFISKYGGRVPRVKSNLDERKAFYKTGKGAFKFVSSHTDIDEKENSIRVDAFAPISDITKTLKAIDEIKGVSETLNDSDKKDRYEVAYKIFFQKNLRGAARDVVLKKVLAKLQAKVRFSVQTTDRFVRPDGTAGAKLRPTTVPELMNKWLADRLLLEQNACTFWIKRRAEEIADLNLLRLAVKMRDFIITAIKEKEKLTDEELAKYIAKGLKITVAQANRILDLKIRQLRKLEDTKLAGKIKELEAESKSYESRRKNPRAYVAKHVQLLKAALAKMPDKPAFK